MPRRNRSHRARGRRDQPEKQEQMSTDAMALDLVERGLADPMILKLNAPQHRKART